MTSPSPWRPETDPFVWTPPRFLRRHAERRARRRLLRRLLALGLGLGLAHGFVLADGGLLSIVRSHLRLRALHAQQARLLAEQAALEREIERRTSDAFTLERMAREEYGLVLPGETVYRILEVSEEEARRLEAKRRRALGDLATR